MFFNTLYCENLSLSCYKRSLNCGFLNEQYEYTNQYKIHLTTCQIKSITLEGEILTDKIIILLNICKSP